MGNNGNTLPQYFIAADMVRMVMGVYQCGNFAVLLNIPQCNLNFFSQFSKLRINQQYTLWPGYCGHIAARASQHINIIGQCYASGCASTILNSLNVCFDVCLFY